jgi:hypothetical protein
MHPTGLITCVNVAVIYASLMVSSLSIKQS